MGGIEIPELVSPSPGFEAEEHTSREQGDIAYANQPLVALVAGIVKLDPEAMGDLSNDILTTYGDYMQILVERARKESDDPHDAIRAEIVTAICIGEEPHSWLHEKGHGPLDGADMQQFSDTTPEWLRKISKQHKSIVTGVWTERVVESGASQSLHNSNDGLEEDNWEEYALCAEADPELFFPKRGKSSNPAKLICEACTVRSQCLEDALTRKENFGIRGGLTEHERRKLKKRTA